MYCKIIEYDFVHNYELNEHFLKETFFSFVMYLVILGCGFCKRLKPEYEAAAVELKGHSVSYLEFYVNH